MNPKEEQTRQRTLKERVLNRKTLQKLGWGAAAFLTVTILFYQIERWRGARAWEVAKKDYLAAGGSLDMQDFIPEIPPAEDNFGALPIFKEIAGEESSLGEENRKKLESMSLRHLSGDTERKEKPKLSQDLEGYLLQSAAFLNLETQGRSPSEIAQELLQVIDQKAGETIAEMQRGATLPQARLTPGPLQANEEEFWAGVPLPHIVPFLNVAETVHLKGLAAIALDNSGSALESLLLTLQLGNLTQNQFWVEAIVAQVIDDRAMNLLEHGILNQIWSYEELELISRAIALPPRWKTFFSMLQTNIIANVQLSDMMISNVQRRTLIKQLNLHASLPFELSRRIKPKGWFVRNKAEMLRVHLPLLQLENSQSDLSEVLQLIQRDKQEREVVMTSFVSSFLLYKGSAENTFSPIDRAGSRIITGDLRRELMRVSCEIERFRLTENRIPDKLSELVPEYLDKIPLDPVDQAPLRYQPHGESGYTLYSIGVDRQDNNGKPPETSEKPTEGTDVVWTVR